MFRLKVCTYLQTDCKKPSDAKTEKTKSECSCERRKRFRVFVVRIYICCRSTDLSREYAVRARRLEGSLGISYIDSFKKELRIKKEKGNWVEGRNQKLVGGFSFDCRLVKGLLLVSNHWRLLLQILICLTRKLWIRNKSCNDLVFERHKSH